MKKFLSAIAWMLASAAGAAHGGSVVFGAPANIATVLRPGGIVVGNFNNDGKEDIAVTSNGSNSVAVLKGNGQGVFGNAITFATGATPNDVRAANLNGDGSR